MSARAGALNLYSQAVDGGTVDRLTTSAIPQWPTSITRDGTRLFGFEVGPKTTRDVFLVQLSNPTAVRDSPSPAVPLAQTLFHGNFAGISPDGRFSRISRMIRAVRGPRATVSAGRQQPLAGFDARRDAARLVAERSRAVLH